MTPHRCPVCLGKQTVPAGFYDGSTEVEKCRSCGGTGVVWQVNGFVVPNPFTLPVSPLVPPGEPTVIVRERVQICTCPKLQPGETWIGDVLCELHKPRHTIVTSTSTDVCMCIKGDEFHLEYVCERHA